ncbi:MAG: hypothetical protein RL136_941 [Planctomycetota bacterium]|jgi:uncharacterized protein YacL
MQGDSPQLDDGSNGGGAPRRRAPQGTRVILLFARLLFMSLVLATPAIVIASRSDAIDNEPVGLPTIIGLTLATGALGLVVVAIDAVTPNKRLASIFGIYFGICLGLVGTYFVGSVLNTIIDAWSLRGTTAALYLDLTKIAIGLILCYVAVSVVMTTKDDFRLVIPYVEFAKQNRGVSPMLLDTSVLIDGRIVDVADSGVLDAPFVVLQVTLNELQKLSDSSDKGRRARGRRGLDMVAKLQASPRFSTAIEDAPVEHLEVDRALIEVAKIRGYRLVTTDAALAKLAEIAGVPSINMNRVAGSMRAQTIAGDRVEVELTRTGEAPTQGVGYLPDGTMVVVEGAADRVGQEVAAIVTNTLTTNAGRMVFARLEAPSSGSTASMVARATSQPKHRDGEPPRDDEHRPSGRNPRRG